MLMPEYEHSIHIQNAKNIRIVVVCDYIDFDCKNALQIIAINPNVPGGMPLIFMTSMLSKDNIGNRNGTELFVY